MRRLAGIHFGIFEQRRLHEGAFFLFSLSHYHSIGCHKLSKFKHYSVRPETNNNKWLVVRWHFGEIATYAWHPHVIKIRRIFSLRKTTSNRMRWRMKYFVYAKLFVRSVCAGNISTVYFNMNMKMGNLLSLSRRKHLQRISQLDLWHVYSIAMAFSVLSKGTWNRHCIANKEFIYSVKCIPHILHPTHWWGKLIAKERRPDINCISITIYVWWFDRTLDSRLCRAQNVFIVPRDEQWNIKMWKMAESATRARQWHRWKRTYCRMVFY